MTEHEKAPTMSGEYDKYEIVNGFIVPVGEPDRLTQLMEFYCSLPPTVKQRIKAVVSQRLAKEDDNHV